MSGGLIALLDDLAAIARIAAASVDVVGGFLAWLVNTLCSAILGFAWGMAVMAVLHPLLKVLPFGYRLDKRSADHASQPG